MSGQVIADRYNLLETLAQGSFGTTHLAQDTYLPDHPQCVVKQLKPDSSDPKFLQISRRLFEQEASILGTLGSHSRIPKLLSYFESEQDFFLVQEFIDGISISQELGQGKRWPDYKVGAFLKECLEILKFVHDLGVIHRDVKPDNLIRRLSDQSIFLLDFGAVKQISRDPSQVVETTIAVGTPGYMPDEQIRGKPHVSSDIYALGTIGIYGLTGIRPIDFERSEEDEILWQDKAEVNADLAEILSKMVRRDYRKRYHCAEAVLTDLQQSDRGLHASLEFQGEQTEVLSHPNTVANNHQGDRPLDTFSSIFTDQHLIQLASASTQAFLNHGVDPVQDNEANRQTAGQLEQGTGAQSARRTAIQSIREKTIQPEKGTAPVYKVGESDTSLFQKLTAVKVLLPSTMLLVGAGVGGFFLFGMSELGQTTGRLNQLYTQQKYSECIRSGETAIEAKGLSEDKLQNPLSNCYLGQANQLAANAKLGDAVQVVAKVSEHSTSHFQAQQKLDEWSARLLADARQDYQVKGNLQQALAWVGQIPETSGVKTKADAQAKQWQSSHKANQQKIATAKEALKAGRTGDAIATAKQIKAPEYWKKIADQLQKDVKAEIANRPAPELPPRQTATAPTWNPAPPTNQTPVDQPRPRPAPPAARPAPAYQPAQSAPAANPAPAAPQKEVVNICPGPLCPE